METRNGRNQTSKCLHHNWLKIKGVNYLKDAGTSNAQSQLVTGLNKLKTVTIWHAESIYILLDSWCKIESELSWVKK